ncbi:hypothetical protein TPHA_0M00390 [Tetrapisispora phaffii CBS 4417]|uniref:Deacetylase sirtuin-type domain-containing protein n=1 Tax=Tetrapisispora phaffii (strain ATCC 24235 / CBS 4417 / NBRC 1672 / NRRL Y-8282 / UCD 70-5) TaxID=1071381 RepID=G8C0V3_TETPH|nr:hypothetical protein TPHA_0M00390 [Tetrapisispora phaffii CBS 4417]CCE65614.1 hypothetical protein TPHA_0M00390 [Tetrapisispora phaffii CBS 4417]
MTEGEQLIMNGKRSASTDIDNFPLSSLQRSSQSQAQTQSHSESESQQPIKKLKTEDIEETQVSVNHGNDETIDTCKRFRDVLKPIMPILPIKIYQDQLTKKYILPKFERGDMLNARLFLKFYGLRKFLDSYLPEQLNTLYLYHIIKLLGFEINDSFLLTSIYKVIETDNSKIEQFFEENKGKLDENYERLLRNIADNESGDPLGKKHAVRLVKDLQKAVNKILCTRIRLSNFSSPMDFVNRLKEAKNILVLTGAGVSTSLGIPDFRSSEGFYSKIKYLGLDDPQDVFNFDIFMQDPSVFYNIAHLVLPPDNICSPLHSFIKMLQDKGKLLRSYTQNIDNLESYAGIKPEKLVQCHGSFATASCVTCHWQLPGEKIFNSIRKMELPLCPYCYPKRKEYFPTEVVTETDSSEKIFSIPSQFDSDMGRFSTFSYVQKSCGVLKPDITFFGEALPSKFHKTIRKDILECDLLICIGTSLKVAPVSEIVNMLPAHVPQVLINKDPVKHAEFDISFLGLCDDVVAYITELCGWDIPHKSWPTLKNTKFNCIENDKGVYAIAPEETPK